MLTKGDIEMLEKTAQHAMQFVFDNAEDDTLCQLTSVLIGMMHAICQRSRDQMLGGNVPMPEHALVGQAGMGMGQLRGVSG